MRRALPFEQFLNEKKSDYQVYHNTYSSAVDAALEYARSNGYEVVMDDVWNEISVGSKKPKGKAIIVCGNRHAVGPGGFGVEFNKDRL